jgi:hypothetical protein
MLTDTADSAINAMIPSTTGWSAMYRIRVVSDNPAVTGTDNGSNITINPMPMVNITASAMTLCAGMTDTLMANPTGGSGVYTTYTWAPGTHANSDTAYFSSTTPGLKHWRVIVTDSNNCSSMEDTIAVTVNALPVANISASAMAICINMTDTLMANATGGSGVYTTYTWAPGTHANSDTAYFVPTTSGVKNWRLKVTDNNGCVSAEDTVTVTANGLPVASIMANDTVLCVGMTDTLMAMVSGGSGVYSTYTWAPGTHANSDMAIFIPTTSGIKHWRLKVTDNNGCVSAEDTITVTANSLPVASIMASTMTLCVNMTDTLMAMASGGSGVYSAYTWAPGTHANSDTAYFIPTTSGVKHWRLKVTDNNGCVSAEDTIAVTANALPIANISASATTICANMTDTLMANATGGSGVYSYYVWSPGTHANSDTAYFSSSTVGVKHWRVIVYDDNGCGSAEDTIAVTVDTLNLSVTMNGDTLMADQANNATYQWIDCGNNNMPISGETNQTFIATANGYYAVVVTIGNSCSDTSACSAITTTGIEKNKLASSVSVYPNPFTTQTTINFNEDQKNTSVRIVDMFGKEVNSFNFSGRQLTIEKGEMKSGIYFLQMQTKQGAVSTKIVVNQ